MRRTSLKAIVLAAALSTGGQASAWLLYPAGDEPSRLIVEVEKSFGDLVPFKALPAPYDRAMQTEQGPDGLTFRWRYDQHAEGMAFLRVDETGAGVVAFRFLPRERLDGRWLGAAAVLVSEGAPLHTFYAKVRLSSARFAGSRGEQELEFAIERPRDWWGSVDAIAFFYMSYHPTRRLDDDGVERAMRRAVLRLTKGQGSEQSG